MWLIWGYSIENNSKNTKNYIAQKLQHGLRALGRATPQALRALGDHYSMSWLAKVACIDVAYIAMQVYVPASNKVYWV